MKLRVWALALCLLLLAGCGRQGTQISTAVITTGGESAEKPPAEDAAVMPEASAVPEPAGEPEGEQGPEDTAGPETEYEEAERPENSENPFAVMPWYFQFASGAGAWSTELTIEADGAFSGLYVDSDMGDSGEGYHGTRYVCAFSGRFTPPEPLDGTTWSMEIEAMELEHPAGGAEEYADGVRYVYSEPYGLEDAETLLLYAPGTPAADLPEDFLNWLRAPWGWEPDEAGALGCWGLYNVSQGYGFAGFE